MESLQGFLTLNILAIGRVSGTQCRGFQFLLILDLWGISFHAVVVFALGKNLLFIFVLGHCGTYFVVKFILLWSTTWNVFFEVNVEKIFCENAAK